MTRKSEKGLKGRISYISLPEPVILAYTVGRDIGA